MNENPVLKEESVIQVEEVVLPQIVSIKQASQRMGLPVYYVRRLCKEVPGMAFQSGVKWYINLGKMAEFQQRNDLCLICQGCRRGWRHPKNLRCNLLSSP